MNETVSSRGCPVSNVSGFQYYDPTPQIQFWVYGFILPVISVWGILANFASIIIFSKKQMRSVINRYLAGLSLFDLMVLLCATMFYPSMSYCLFLDVSYACIIFHRSTPVLYPLSLIARFCSIWCCVCISVDRFIAVVFPIRRRFWCSERNASICLSVVALCGILYCSPTAFELRWNSDYLLEKTGLRNSPSYTFWYKANLNLLVLLIAPWTIMITLNVFIIRSIRGAFRTQKKISSSSRNGRSSHRNEDRRSTIIAILVCTSLLIFNIFSQINNYIQEADTMPTNSSNCIWKRTLVFFGNALICLNSATNCMVYCIFGPKYRREFVNLFKREADIRTVLVPATSMMSRSQSARISQRNYDKPPRFLTKDEKQPFGISV